jgi:transcriptional regulator with XRE-family HTH domain
VGDISAGNGWTQAARLLNQRMADLGLTQFDLASRSGVSPATIREILHGKPRQRSPRTLSALSKALGWPSGQISEIVRGATPPTRETQPASNSDVSTELRAIREELARINRRIEALEAEQAADDQ